MVMGSVLFYNGGAGFCSILTVQYSTNRIEQNRHNKSIDNIWKKLSLLMDGNKSMF
jgi:hypothetical protein